MSSRSFVTGAPKTATKCAIYRLMRTLSKLMDEAVREQHHATLPRRSEDSCCGKVEMISGCCANSERSRTLQLSI
jgi:hypothetical protein